MRLRPRARSTTYETVLRPEPGSHYQFEVSAADKIYGARMRKASAGSNDWTDQQFTLVVAEVLAERSSSAEQRRFNC